MICPNCGKEYNERMTCCISCGSSLVPYEQDSEQVILEPVLPEAEPEPEFIAAPVQAEFAGFVRGLDGHSEYPPEPEPEKNSPAEAIPISVKKGNTSASEAVKTIGSLAASVIMLAFIVLAAASFAVRLTTDSKKISEFADTLDVMSFPAAETGMSFAEGYEIAPDATLQEAIFVMSAGTGLTREDIREIYENSTVGDFLASQLNSYADFIREGELPEKLTPEKLKTVFSENIGLISDAIGVPLSQHDIDLAFSELDRTEEILEAIAPSRLESLIGGETLTALRLFSSLPVIIAEACIAAAMLIILRAINKNTEKVLGWGGGTVLAGGAVVLSAAFLCSVQVFFSGQDRIFRSIVKCVTDVINPDLYRLGVILVIIGAVMLLWAATLRRQGRRTGEYK